jgi:hypothetical protein
MAVRLSTLCAGRRLTPGRFLVLISVRGWVDPRAIVRLEGLGQLKNCNSSGLDPATFRLVAKCFNQLRYRVPSTPLMSLRKLNMVENRNCPKLLVKVFGIELKKLCTAVLGLALCNRQTCPPENLFTDLQYKIVSNQYNFPSENLCRDLQYKIISNQSNVSGVTTWESKGIPSVQLSWNPQNFRKIVLNIKWVFHLSPSLLVETLFAPINT